MGRTWYIVSEPEHTNSVYKNMDTLSFIEFVRGLFKTHGCSEEAMRLTYTDLPKNKPGFPNPGGKSLGGTLVRQMHIHQLHPGSNLDALECCFHDYFQKHLEFTTLRRTTSPYLHHQDQDSVYLPLMRWCSEYFVRAGSRAYFGDILEYIDPMLTSKFIEFDDLSWQALYQYPDFLSQRMTQMKNQVQATFLKYFSTPQILRHGEAWFTRTMESELRALGVQTNDIAVLMRGMHWAYVPLATRALNKHFGVTELTTRLIGSARTRERRSSGY